MSTHRLHTEKNDFYFITFTCYKWLPLLEATQIYNYLPGWFRELGLRGVKTCAYVAMPNHLHMIIFLEENARSLNLVIGESKRFMAYEIVKRLKELNRDDLLSILEDGVREKEKKANKKHQVFRLSFDAKLIKGDKEMYRVLDYIHHNPVSGKWILANDYLDFRYSSARFYEFNEKGLVDLVDFRIVQGSASESPLKADDSE